MKKKKLEIIIRKEPDTCYLCRKEIGKCYINVLIKWASNNKTGRRVGEVEIKMCDKCFKEFKSKLCLY